MKPAELNALLAHLTDDERKEFDSLLAADLQEVVWRPLPGPQTMAYESTADVIGFGGSAGGGKGLALDTLLPTPAGFVAMGDVQVGQVLFDDSGSPCNVVAVSGMSSRPCFRLTFDDGTTVVADDVHRWVTFDAKELGRLTKSDPEWKAARRAKRPSRAKATTSAARMAALRIRNAAHSKSLPLPTGTMRDTLALHETLRTESGRANHAIRMAGPVQTEAADLPIPPYTLGAWLGDGASRNGQLTGIDPGIWERVEADGFEVRHYSWSKQAHNIIGLKVMLRDSGLLQNKHIPMEYMRASASQRLDLLRGLMDTDGHATLVGGCEFDGVNQALVSDVFDLVRSLGIKATLQQGVAKLNGRVIGDKWRVSFTTAVNVFGLARKSERLSAVTRRTQDFRYLVACEPVESVPTKCISVDSPSRMYLATKAMLPTHNSDLAIGKALNKHYEVMVMRREATQLHGILSRLEEILGGRDGFNGQDKIWRNAGPRSVKIEFGSVPNLGDETKHQGRPHDLLVFDEAANFLQHQVMFLLGWNRSTREGVHSQALLTFNPPTTAEGRWVVDFFAPWLDIKHPLYPTAPGDIRHCVTLPNDNGTSKYIWVDDASPCVIASGELVFDFDQAEYQPEDIITPRSVTFIPSRISDNPYLANSGYLRVLQAMPEPLRSQMLYGDFQAGMTDDPWQVIPTAWVQAAMDRWVDRSPKGEMLSMGVDVARGGKDNTTIATRHKTKESNYWFDNLFVAPGSQTPDGPVVAGLVIAKRKDKAPIHLDVIGVGASPYDVLRSAGQAVYGVNVAEKATSFDKSGRLSFMNLRSQLWWQFRELLDPDADNGIALHPDKELLAELCAPLWKMSGMSIQVESRDAIVQRTGRSPDRATAVILAAIDTPKMRDMRSLGGAASAALEYDPYSAI